MKWFTKQEQDIICVLLGLIVLGLVAKTYRAATKTPAPVQALNNPENLGKR